MTSSCQNTHKNRQNSENEIFMKTEPVSRNLQESTYRPNLKDLPWFMRPCMQKNEFNLWSYETKTRSILSPIGCIYPVSNLYLKTCPCTKKCPENFEKPITHVTICQLCWSEWSEIVMSAPTFMMSIECCLKMAACWVDSLSWWQPFSGI